MSIFVVVVSVTLGVSALCSLFEATLYSTRTAALEAARGNPQRADRARLFLALKHDIGAPTSAILILNTIANTTGATIAGALAARLLGPGLMPVFSVALTLAILFLSEILPKTTGAVHWRGLWPLIARPLTLTLEVLRPFVWVTTKFSQLLVSSQQKVSVGEDEILAMIRLGASTGEVSSTKLDLLTAVFQFEGALAREAMVPRVDVDWIEAGTPVRECLEIVRRTHHTRYPLSRGGLDEPIGVIHVKDLLSPDVDPDEPVDRYARPVRTVPETLPIAHLLRDMQRSRQHLAVVLDEHGSTRGIVTLENILEQIVGAVQDEFDDEAPDVLTEKEGIHLVRGQLAISRLNRSLGLDLPLEPGVVTLSGLIVERLGRLPRRGDKVDLDGVGAEVVEVEDNRATRVRLS